MESTLGKTNSTPTTRRNALLALVAIVVLVALPVRLYLSITGAMISRDGVNFIWYAQGLADHPVVEMRRQPQHPLYPALVLATHVVLQGPRQFIAAADPLADPVFGWEVAAVAVTLAGGLAVVIATYALAAGVFDRRTGLIAAALAATAAEFCQLSADGLTDMPHLAVYLFAMAAAVHGLRDRGKAWLLVAGVLSGLAFLLRPEGAEVAVVAAVLVLGARGWRRRQRLAGVLALALGAGLVASPYMLVTGKLVQKKSIGRFWGRDAASTSIGGVGPAMAQASRRFRAARAEARGSCLAAPRSCQEGVMVAGGPPALAAVTDVGRALGRIAENWWRSLRVTFMLPVIAWLIRRRDVQGDPGGHRLIAAAGLLHVLILVALLIRFDYWGLFSLRHVVVLAGLTLPFSAAGVVAILNTIESRRRRVVALILGVAMIAPTLPWLLEARHADRAYLRRAGEWIRAHTDGTPRILTTRHRVAFYANGIHVFSPLDAEVEPILAEARLRKPDWLVFDERRMLKASAGFFDEIQRARLPGEVLEPVHAESSPTPKGKGANRAIIYRYQAPRE